ncbi:MAG TPA: hypothetical protein VFL57_11660 [Bryobacteraceae bacterium]|nr:hypothetical protein [Bryobacteraceae bacterium]
MKRVVLACMLALAAWAADVSGKWRAEFTTPDGTQRVNTFTFRMDGERLTGTVAGTQDETPIRDGKVSGDTISFTADRPFGTFTYKGRISGNEIRFTVQFNDNSFDITAKRVN